MGGGKRRLSLKNTEDEIQGQFLKGLWLDFLSLAMSLRDRKPEKDQQANKHTRTRMSDSKAGP